MRCRLRSDPAPLPRENGGRSIRRLQHQLTLVRDLPAVEDTTLIVGHNKSRSMPLRHHSFGGIFPTNVGTERAFNRNLARDRESRHRASPCRDNRSLRT
jgi:hypothetical protein